MKTDARVRYTKKVLRDALLGCMQQKPLREITVKEVCQRAELNRATFYAHYRDCRDLFEQIENEMLEQYRGHMRSLDALNVRGLIRAIYQMIDSNRDLCELMIFNHADDALIHRMLGLAHDFCIESWRQAMPRASNEEVELLFSCLAAGILHVVIGQYGRHDREVIVEFVGHLVESCLASYRD